GPSGPSEDADGPEGPSYISFSTLDHPPENGCTRSPDAPCPASLRGECALSARRVTRHASFHDDQVAAELREQVAAVAGDENVVDDPGAQALVAEEDRGLDAHHHSGLERVCASTQHVHRFPPGGRETGGQAISGGVHAAPLETGLVDHAFGRLVRNDRRHA